MPAARALEIGLVHAIAPADKVLAVATGWAKRLASGPSAAHSMTKEMLTREQDLSFSEAIEAEAQSQTILMSSNDFRRAYEAFAAKREPTFEGD